MLFINKTKDDISFSLRNKNFSVKPGEKIEIKKCLALAKKNFLKTIGLSKFEESDAAELDEKVEEPATIDVGYVVTEDNDATETEEAPKKKSRKKKED